MLPSSHHQQICCCHLEFPQKNVGGVTITMLRPALACCKLYISEARNAPALRAIERAAAAFRPAVVLVNAFADDAYNRVGYTLVAPLAGGDGGGGGPALPPLHRAAFGVVAAALEAVDFGAHAGAHPRLGVVDHIAFHPLAGAHLDDVAALTRAVAADIGDKLQGSCAPPNHPKM
jgi:glutamate formiminotransferase